MRPRGLAGASGTRGLRVVRLHLVDYGVDSSGLGLRASDTNARESGRLKRRVARSAGNQDIGRGGEPETALDFLIPKDFCRQKAPDVLIGWIFCHSTRLTS